jgi:branched-chain amino acid transport system permease protein
MALRPHHFILWGLFIAGMLLMPELVGKGTLRTMIFACYLAMFAISWDILSGRTGYISFGHPFLIGIGAYTTAILTRRYGFPVEASIPIAVVVTMFGGLIVLLPALRIKGSYFALVTLAVMELMLQLVPVVRPDLTGGTRGISRLPALTRGAENGYYLAVGLMLAVALFSWLLMRTRLGTALWAIGMNEESVRGSGLSTTRLKSFAFLVSAAIAGLAGAFYAHYLGTITPRTIFDVNMLFQIIVACLLGGAGTIFGPIIGAFFMVFLLAWLRQAVSPEMVEALPFLESVRDALKGQGRFFVYAVIALLLYMYQPKGIMAIGESLWAKLRRAKA